MSNITSTPPQPEQGFVTAKTIARHYNITEPTVYRWANEGKIPSLRFESTIRFNFKKVRAAIEGGAK